MEQALHNTDTIESIYDLVTLNNSSGSNLLNTHAPLKNKEAEDNTQPTLVQWQD